MAHTPWESLSMGERTRDPGRRRVVIRRSRICALMIALAGITLAVGFDSRALMVTTMVLVACTIIVARAYAVRRYGHSEWAARRTSRS